MNNNIIADYEKRNLILKFEEKPSAKIRVKLNNYGYKVSNPRDTQYTFENFELNHELALLSFEYLDQQNDYKIKKTQVLEKFLINLKTRGDILDLAKVGKSIKECDNRFSEIPPSFKRILMDYQRMPVYHFKELKCVANFSVPGSGKTTIVLAAFDFLKNEGIADKLLVIGPYSSLMPWEEEVKECFKEPPNLVRIHGKKKDRIESYNDEILILDTDIFLTTYETARRDLRYLIELLSRYKFMMVLDESHNIKNIDGKRSSAILRLSPYSSTKIILTGSPVPNTIHDLFAQFSFLYPGALLGDKNHFKYLTRNSNPSVIEDIKEKIYPFFTRISKIQMNLPKPKEIVVQVPLSPPQLVLYKLVSERWRDIIEYAERLVHFEAINSYKNCLIVRLRQISSNLNLLMEKSTEYGLESLKDEIAGQSQNIKTDSQIMEVINNLEVYSDFECSPKLLKTVELVKKLKNEKNVKKILIWSEFIINLETLYEFFKEEYGGDQVFLIIGDTPKSKAKDLRNGIYTEESREDYISRFKKNPDEFSILIANPQACAESISLHKVCHDAIYVDRSYNCGQFIQSKDRIHRIGLANDDQITYYYLVSFSDDLPQGTIDHKIHNRLIEKEIKMLNILNDTESFIGFSNEPDAEEFEIFYGDI